MSMKRERRNTLSNLYPPPVTGPASRRGFLRGLTTLPLIGGSVTLIGDPVAAAEPPSLELLQSYSAFLHFERRYLNAVLYPQVPSKGVSMFVPMDNRGAVFHDREAWIHGVPTWPHQGQAAQNRAAIVLAAVGCNWKEA